MAASPKKGLFNKLFGKDKPPLAKHGSHEPRHTADPRAPSSPAQGYASPAHTDSAQHAPRHAVHAHPVVGKDLLFSRIADGAYANESSLLTLLMHYCADMLMAKNTSQSFQHTISGKLGALVEALRAISAFGVNEMEYRDRITLLHEGVCGVYEIVVLVREHVAKTLFHGALKQHRQAFFGAAVAAARTRPGISAPGSPGAPPRSQAAAASPYSSASASGTLHAGAGPRGTKQSHGSDTTSLHPSDASSGGDSGSESDSENALRPERGAYAIEHMDAWDREVAASKARFAMYMREMQIQTGAAAEVFKMWMEQQGVAEDSHDDTDSLFLAMEHEPTHALAMNQVAWMIKMLSKTKLRALSSYYATVTKELADCLASEHEETMARLEATIAKPAVFSRQPKMILSAVITTLLSAVERELVPLEARTYSLLYKKRMRAADAISVVTRDMDRIVTGEKSHGAAGGGAQRAHAESRSGSDSDSDEVSVPGAGNDYVEKCRRRNERKRVRQALLVSENIKSSMLNPFFEQDSKFMVRSDKSRDALATLVSGHVRQRSTVSAPHQDPVPQPPPWAGAGGHAAADTHQRDSPHSGAPPQTPPRRVIKKSGSCDRLNETGAVVAGSPLGTVAETAAAQGAVPAAPPGKKPIPLGRQRQGSVDDWGLLGVQKKFADVAAGRK